MQGKSPAYDGSWAAKEIATDKGPDSMNEKCPKNLVCCHKRLYINACAGHDSFPLTVYHYGAMMSLFISQSLLSRT